MPFVADLMMGLDFRDTIFQQMELLFSIKTGSFPLYHPGYVLGHSSVVMTWSQLFHPISHLASVMPGYWNGKAVQWYTFLKLLSLGFTQLVLFAFLRNLRLNMLFSFLISFITVYNLRMLDLFRFGASLEAYTGYLLLCTVIGWYFVHPSRWLGPLSIIIATYLLIVSGHPQHMYYGLIGAGLFLLLVPFFLSNILVQHINFNNVLRFWVKTGFFMTIGILLASVYILPIYFDFYTTNIGRADASETRIPAEIGFFEILNNFFLPFHSDVNHEFGGSSLILVGALTPFLLCFRVKTPRFVWIIWGILVFVFLFMLGDMTPVYKLAWEHLPFLSAFRHQGKIAIIIPIFLMMLLVWVIKAEPCSLRFRGFSYKTPPYSILALIALLLIPVYLFLYLLLKPVIGIFPGGILPVSFNSIPRWTILLTILVGEASLIGLILYGINWQESRALRIFLLLMTIIQVGMLLRYGTFIEPLQIQRTFEEIKAQKKERLDDYRFIQYNITQNAGMHHSAVITQLERSFIEPYIGKIYSQIIPVDSQDDAYNRMMQERLPQQLFIEGYDFEKAKMITEGAKGMKEGTVELVYSSFNRMQFRVVSQSPAFFGFSYPYMNRWNAWVNNERVHVYRANGAAHAVEIPEGESIVEFRYWSDAYFWGMVVSLTTLAVIGFFICFRASNGLPRVISIILIFTVSIGGFILWYNSLYSGDNLKTEYIWTYKPPLKTPNLAYGKKVFGYSPLPTRMQWHGSRAVDGDIKLGSGFTLDPFFEKPFSEPLTVDLYKNQEIKTILLYGKFRTKPIIAISLNGEQWQKLAFDFAEGSHVNLLRIIFEKPQVARFVKIEASDSPIGIDELEVYGTEVL